MSGWIKVEKDVLTDPRFRRMARNYRNDDVTHERFTIDAVETLLFGALVRLWIFADTHIRSDDTLDLGPDEIDELVGVEQFAHFMPPEWLEVLDAHRVKLPGFQGHNGTEAKKKALTQRRVEKHRSKPVTQERSDKSDSCNAPALPDQTRPDQTKTRPKEERVPSEPVEQGSTNVPREALVERRQTQERIFQHWQETHGYMRAVLDAKRRKLIAKALEHYSEADLCQSISGYKLSPHHQGQNERDTTYTSIELLLRDSKHIDDGLNFYRNPPRTHLSQITRQNIDAVADWVPPEIRHAAN